MKKLVALVPLLFSISSYAHVETAKENKAKIQIVTTSRTQCNNQLSDTVNLLKAKKSIILDQDDVCTSTDGQIWMASISVFKY